MKTLLVVLGPTGVGKTELSIDIASHFNIPIINADSRQLYKELPIGTAAPTKEQQEKVKHFFVGTLSINDYYSASMYEQDVLSLLDQLFADSDYALLSGGSMMYIDAVCNGIDEIPSVDEATRNNLKQRFEEEGMDRMLNELKLLDPEYYQVVDTKNPRRIIHALEVCYMTGRTYTSFRTKQKKQRPFNIKKIGLQMPREIMFDRINRRVDKMIDSGFIHEAANVYPKKGLNSLNTVGYKELFDYFDGKTELDYAIKKIQKNTRVYCKKQMTWFKKDESIVWFHPNEIQAIINYIEQ